MFPIKVSADLQQVKCKSRLRCTPTQLSVLIEFMGQNPQFANLECEDFQEAVMWKRLREILKYFGPDKTEKQWRKSWRTLRNRVQSAENEDSLSEPHKRVLAILQQLKDDRIEKKVNHSQGYPEYTRSYEQNDQVLTRECRACLVPMDSNSTRRFIFEAWEPPWCGTTVAQALANITNIEIAENDPHSKVICCRCYDTLQSACEFIEIVQRNNKCLKERILKNPSLLAYEWPKPIELERNVNDTLLNTEADIKEEIFSEEENDWCGNGDSGHLHPIASETVDKREQREAEEFGSVENVRRLDNDEFERMEIKVEPQDVVLNGVNSQSEEVSQASHVDSVSDQCYEEEHLDPNIKSEPSSEGDLSDIPLDCVLCDKSLRSYSGLKAHVISNHSYKNVRRKNNTKTRRLINVCKTCGRCFQTSTDLMVHETCHNKLVCYGCRERFDSFQLLAEHRLQCRAKGGQKARIRTLDEVRRHSPIPTTREDMKVVTCTICDSKLMGPYMLKIHNEIHHSSQAKYEVSGQERSDENLVEKVLKGTRNYGVIRKNVDKITDSSKANKNCRKSTKVNENNKMNESVKLNEVSQESVNVNEYGQNSTKVQEDNQDSGEFNNSSQKSSKIKYYNPESTKPNENSQEFTKANEESRDSAEKSENSQDCKVKLNDFNQKPTVNEDNHESTNVNEDSQEPTNVNEDSQEPTNVNEDSQETTNVNEDSQEPTNVNDDSQEPTNVNEDSQEPTKENEVSRDSTEDLKKILEDSIEDEERYTISDDETESKTEEGKSISQNSMDTNITQEYSDVVLSTDKIKLESNDVSNEEVSE